MQNGQPTLYSADNSVYWVMADFLKRQTVVTAGFVDLYNPHRMPSRMPGEGDPRLGPYLVNSSGTSVLPAGYLPRYDWSFEPPLEQLAGRHRGGAGVPRSERGRPAHGERARR